MRRGFALGPGLLFAAGALALAAAGGIGWATDARLQALLAEHSHASDREIRAEVRLRALDQRLRATEAAADADPVGVPADTVAEQARAAQARERMADALADIQSETAAALAAHEHAGIERRQAARELRRLFWSSVGGMVACALIAVAGLAAGALQIRVIKDRRGRPRADSDS